MQGYRERVLIVDDEPRVLLALSDLLSESYVVLSSDSLRGARANRAVEPRTSWPSRDHGHRQRSGSRCPGVPDIELAMRDGYSTGNSLGVGLPGARRLVDEIELVSAS